MFPKQPIVTFFIPAASKSDIKEADHSPDLMNLKPVVWRTPQIINLTTEPHMLIGWAPENHTGDFFTTNCFHRRLPDLPGSNTVTPPPTSLATHLDWCLGIFGVIHEFLGSLQNNLPRPPLDSPPPWFYSPCKPRPALRCIKILCFAYDRHKFNVIYGVTYIPLPRALTLSSSRHN